MPKPSKKRFEEMFKTASDLFRFEQNRFNGSMRAAYVTNSLSGVTIFVVHGEKDKKLILDLINEAATPQENEQ